MKKRLIVGGAVVSALAAAALLVPWRQSSDPLAGAGVEAPAERQAAASAQPAPPPAAKMPAEPAEPPASASVLFDFDSAALGAAEAAKLDRLIEAHVKRPQFSRIEAAGHADRLGGAAYNMELSARRAAAVRDYFVGRSVDAGKVRTAARGELDSVTGDSCFRVGAELKGSGGLVECLRPDRRVEISVVTSL